MIQLTPKQKKIIDSPARIKLVMGGQRSGKTILAIMAAWDMMTKSAMYSRVLFLTPSDRFQKQAVDEIKCVLPVESIISIGKEQTPDGKIFTLIKTDRGDIFVSDRFIPTSYDGIVFDNATSSKYLSPEMLERGEKLYITGHCPDDMNNAFFLMWLTAYFSDNSDKQAFRLGTWECPAMDPKKVESENHLINRMGKHRYNRSYLCVPDFLDQFESNPSSSNWLRREYVFREPNHKEFNRQYLGKW